MTARSRLIVDGHVHIYPCFDLDMFFQSVDTNMEKFLEQSRHEKQETHRILLFTEGKENDFFARFKNGEILFKHSDYKFQKTKEETSLVLTDNGKPLCYILRGRQIVTKENLEILAVASGQHIPDGLPVQDVIKKIIDQKEIAVLAWGVGKWFFKRGKIIKQIISEMKSPYPYLFIGDNSARPGFWPTPKLFNLAKKLEISLINGSDPLPFAEEVEKVGSYGFTIEGEFDPAEPGKSFRETLLANSESIRFFGSRDSAISFFKRQLKMFLKKHF